MNEPGADRVRQVAHGADGLASCEAARLEFASILKRHVREHHVTRREATAILKDFEEDEHLAHAAVRRLRLGNTSLEVIAITSPGTAESLLSAASSF